MAPLLIDNLESNDRLAISLFYMNTPIAHAYKLQRTVQTSCNSSIISVIHTIYIASCVVE